jgi:septal ring factor EnvC (AmiA/AmiB activator)
VSAALPLVLTLVLSGAPFEVDTRELEAVRTRIARERVRNHFLRRKETSALRAILRLDRSIEERTGELERLGERMSAVETDLRRVRARLDAVQDRLSALHARAGRRAAAMHRIRRIGLEAFLVGIEDPVAQRRAEDRFRFVIAHDGRLARQIRAVRDRRAEAVAEVEAKRAELRATEHRLADERAELALEQAERRAFVEALRRERVESDRLARRLRRAERGAAKESDRLRGHRPPPAPRPGGFGRQRGALAWPTPGRVEVTFGHKVDPATGVVLQQSGIDLRAEEGALVRAPFAGTVSAARWVDGFGRTVVLDHGDGWFTVYGHLQAFWTEPGRPVRRRQVLGTVGASGSEKGAFLYFEIRRGPEPVDPLDWLAE